MKETTMGERLPKWKMFLQSYNFTNIHTTGKHNVFADVLQRIYEGSTANTEAEIMEDPTINKSFSTLTFLLSLSFPDQYSPLLDPHFASSNVTSCSSVLSSNLDYYYHKYQPDTIPTM
jgi:hypothetical protein